MLIPYVTSYLDLELEKIISHLNELLTCTAITFLYYTFACKTEVIRLNDALPSRLKTPPLVQVHASYGSIKQ